MTDETLKINGKVLGALVSVALFLLMQTGAALWWASSLSTSLTFIQQDIVELKEALKSNTTYRYTSQDAQLDKKMMLEQCDAIKNRITFNDGRITDLTARVSALEKK